jgi:methylated-DNA-[protein]-cysteine S-methyltransferase
MSDKPTACVRIEGDLLATAIGEAPSDAARRVEQHIARCGSCRQEFENYRAVDSAVAAIRDTPSPTSDLAHSRERLDTQLADLRSRLLVYRIFPSPLGKILIARSELGISLIEYLERGTSLRVSRLGHAPGVELAEGGADLDPTYRELLEYLQGQRTRLTWPLDLRLVRSGFHRTVLQATAAIPYGAVMPYAGIAKEIGKAPAVRAVAQALRWNPLPIVIPCHRVIGTSGALTGYAGGKIDLKQKLLSVEGIPTAKKAGAVHISPESMYVLYPGDREYCLPSCSSLETRQPAPLTRFASRANAEAAGFAPCTACRPDLHPISR